MNHVTHLIDDYVDGSLAVDKRREVENHAQVCAECRRELEEVQQLVASIRSMEKSVSVPDDVKLLVEETADSLMQEHLIVPENNRRVSQMARLWSFPIVRIAAAIALILGISVPIIYNLTKSGNEKPETVEKGFSQLPPIAQQPAESTAVVVPEARKERTKQKALQKHGPTASIAEHKQSAVSTKAALKITGSLIGKITDSQTGAPLVGANVLILGIGRGAVTDTTGRFAIHEILPGTYTARVSSVGYGTSEVLRLDVVANERKEFAVGLLPQDIAMEGVTVEGDVPLVDVKKSAGAQIVNQGEAQSQEALPLSGVEDIAGQMAGAAKANPQFFLRGSRATESFVQMSSFDNEQYDNIDDNLFREAIVNPLSTFSIDVDNASYSNIRRFLNSGQAPPKDAVRIEEMINYFTYDYPQPKDKHPFSVNMELSYCPWNLKHQLLLVGLQGQKYEVEDLPPSNLVFLIDVSGSMQPENKLPLLKSAFRLLAGQLRQVDHVAIAVYAGNAGLVLPSTSGSNKEAIIEALDQLQSGGSTAGGAGINLAYSIAKENFLSKGNNRVILATDGDFNVGVSSDGELVRLIEEKRNDGIFLSVLGFGMGNLKDSKMEKLADKGNGNYAYIDNIQEARKVLVGQMAGTLYTIAKDVKIQIEFNPARVKSYRLVGYENRILQKEDFNDDRKDAGDMGAGHSVTALYEIVPEDGEVDLPIVDSLKYQQLNVTDAARRSDEMATVKLRYKLPSDSTSKPLVRTQRSKPVAMSTASGNLRFAAAVAEFGMLLRDSKFKGDSSYEDVLRLARGAKGEDAEGYRAEFIRLVETSRLLPRRE